MHGCGTEIGWLVSVLLGKVALLFSGNSFGFALSE